MAENTDIVTVPESNVGSTLSVASERNMQEFLRYFFASLLALAADAGALYLLTSYAGVPYLYSGAAAFLLGLTVVYLLSISWVFEHRVSHNPWLEFGIFALIGIVGLGINELVLYVFTGIFGWYYLLSKAASVVVVFSWNFIARKRILFAHE